MILSLTGLSPIFINGVETTINNLVVNQDVQMVYSDRGTKPDPAWEHVDAAGHFHAYDRDGELPTLDREAVDVPCDGSCGGQRDGDGYTSLIYRCALCREEVEPGRIPDRNPIAIPGRRTGRFSVPIPLVMGAQVSFRAVTERGEVFGIAIPVEIHGWDGGVETTLDIIRGGLRKARKAAKA